jgi:hypothetical protein
LWRVIVSFSTGAKGMDAWIRERLASVRKDPSLAGAIVFLVSAVALVWAWASFMPLLEAMTLWVDRAPASSLALLAPSNVDQHDSYRNTFSALTVATVAAWFVVGRLGARRRRFSAGLMAGAAAVVCLEAATLSISYRLLRHNTFPVVKWGVETCYVTGESADQRLLFCPNRTNSRNQIIPRSSPIEDLNRKESPFTAFSTR